MIERRRIFSEPVLNSHAYGTYNSMDKRAFITVVIASRMNRQQQAENK